MSFETACFSISSDISMRMRLSLSSNKCAASALVVAVFQTPVGPAKRKLPMGLASSESPVLARISAADSCWIF